MSTLLELRGKLRTEMRKDPNGRIQADSLLDRNLNKAVDKIAAWADFAWPHCDGDYSVTTTPSDGTYDLPEDFVRIEKGSREDVNIGSVKFNTKPLREVDFRWLKTTFPSLSIDGDVSYYSVRGFSIYLFKRPTIAAALEFLYRKSPSEMVDDDDDCFFGSDFDKAIVFYAKYYCFRDFDPDSAKIAYDDFTNEVILLQAKYLNRDENTGDFTMELAN